MSGRIIAIYVADTKHAEAFAVDAVQLKAAKGIVGDRFFGTRKTQVGRNLTLIESETIANFNSSYQQTISLGALRRNFVTEGIRLNALVGQTFRVGNVLCLGVELCEPCVVMARPLSQSSLSSTAIIKALTHKGGIRAQVLSEGIVCLDDRITSFD